MTVTSLDADGSGGTGGSGHTGSDASFAVSPSVALTSLAPTSSGNTSSTAAYGLGSGGGVTSGGASGVAYSTLSRRAARKHAKRLRAARAAVRAAAAASAAAAAAAAAASLGASAAAAAGLSAGSQEDAATMSIPNPSRTEDLLPLPPGEVVIRFSVQDTGLGIPSNKMEKLFEPFKQVDASTTREFGGTGLGLAICVRLVHLMRGAFWLESVQVRTLNNDTFSMISCFHVIVQVNFHFQF